MRTVPSKDQYYIDLLPAIASRSKDPRTQVGCVIVGQGGEIRATGFNGFPSGVRETPERWERETKGFYVNHAEANAVAAAAKVGTTLNGCTAYINFAPCAACMKLLISAGIDTVVIDKENHDRVGSARWEDEHEAALDMAIETFVDVVWWERTCGE